MGLSGAEWWSTDGRMQPVHSGPGPRTLRISHCCPTLLNFTSLSATQINVIRSIGPLFLQSLTIASTATACAQLQFRCFMHKARTDRIPSPLHSPHQRLSLICLLVLAAPSC